MYYRRMLYKGVIIKGKSIDTIRFDIHAVLVYSRGFGKEYMDGLI